MSASHWFARVLMEASYPSEPVVLRELEQILDTAQPTKIDPTDSYAIDGSFFIAHTQDRWGDIEIEVDADHADLMSDVRELRISAADFGDQWTKQTAREVERIIRGRYRISWIRWRDKIIHTTVTDHEGATIRDSSSRWELLPIPQRRLVRDHFELDYGCNPDGPAPS